MTKDQYSDWIEGLDTEQWVDIAQQFGTACAFQGNKSIHVPSFESWLIDYHASSVLPDMYNEDKDHR